MTASKQIHFLPSVEYPPEIQGSLRSLLQLKDSFMSALVAVEKYRSCLLTCLKGFHRELANYHLNVGINVIKQLRSQLDDVHHKSKSKLKTNKFLRQYLKKKYAENQNESIPEGIEGIEFLSNLKIPTLKMEQENHNKSKREFGLKMFQSRMNCINTEPQSDMESVNAELNGENWDLPQEIDLGITRTKSGHKLLPAIEFYSSFYFLQMHFQVTMCLAINYSMPFITHPVSFKTRLLGWPSEPSCIVDGGGISQRLRDLNTEVTSLLTRIIECLEVVEDKMRKDKLIEDNFKERMAAQENVIKNLLSCINSQRKFCAELDIQNGRLTGLSTKLESGFSRIAKSYGIEEGNDSINERKTPSIKMAKKQSGSYDNPKYVVANQIFSPERNNQLEKSNKIIPASVVELLLGSESVIAGRIPESFKKSFEPNLSAEVSKEAAQKENFRGEIEPCMKTKIYVSTKTTVSLSSSAEENDPSAASNLADMSRNETSKNVMSSSVTQNLHIVNSTSNFVLNAYSFPFIKVPDNLSEIEVTDMKSENTLNNTKKSGRCDENFNHESTIVDCDTSRIDGSQNKISRKVIKSGRHMFNRLGENTEICFVDKKYDEAVLEKSIQSIQSDSDNNETEWLNMSSNSDIRDAEYPDLNYNNTDSLARARSEKTEVKLVQLTKEQRNYLYKAHKRVPQIIGSPKRGERINTNIKVSPTSDSECIPEQRDAALGSDFKENKKYTTNLKFSKEKQQLLIENILRADRKRLKKTLDYIMNK